MNKQELIKALDEAFNGIKSEMGKTNMGTSDHYVLTGTLDGISGAFNLAKQLDEPVEKAVYRPVVPQFVADWYKENMHNLENGICQLCIDTSNGNLKEDMKDWFNTNNNHAIETLINMQYGYNIERAPKWVIKCPTGYVESLIIRNNYTGGDSAEEYTRKGVTPIKDSAIRFTDKSKAQVLATLVGEGEVKEWTK